MSARVTQGRLALLRCLRFAGTGWTLVLGIVLAVAALLPAAFAITTGALVAAVPGAVQGGFDSPGGTRLLRLLVIIGGLLMAERVVAPVNDVVRWAVARRVDGRLRDQVLVSLEAPEGIGHLEEPGLQDRMALLKGGLFGTIGSASVAAAAIVARYVHATAALAVVAWFSVPLALFVGAVIVTIRIRWHRAFGELAGAITSSGRELRKVSYTVDLAVTPPAAKELRVFGLVEWLVERAAGYWTAAISTPFAVRRRLRTSANVELGLLGVAYVATSVVVARGAINDGLSLGVVAAVLQAQFIAAELISPNTDDFATPAGLAGLAAVEAVAAAADGATAPSGTRSAAGLPAREIRFEGVGFAYPGSERPVVEGLDLTLRAGESVAVVGLNGAGKTTLVKLLTGLYRPTAGRIVVDGIPLQDLDVCSWRRSIGVIFQDFVHYDLSLRDNVAPSGEADDETLAGALEAAGAADLAAALPQGWETVLSRQYEGGAELSGGQWQRVALARALYAVRSDARVLVLDEPTANLDVRAEVALFDAFLRWTEGTTSILISHRFSSVRRAGRIVVLADGRVVEDGTHEDLLAKGGRYAEMFRVQAAQFTAGASGG